MRAVTAMLHSHEPDDGVVIAMTAVPDLATASLIARALVEESLAACCNVVPGVTSIFRWEGEVRESAELLIVIKSTKGQFELLRERIAALHPYDVPEVVSVRVDGIHRPYLDWLLSAVSGLPDKGL